MKKIFLFINFFFLFNFVEKFFVFFLTKFCFFLQNKYFTKTPEIASANSKTANIFPSITVRIARQKSLKFS